MDRLRRSRPTLERGEAQQTTRKKADAVQEFQVTKPKDLVPFSRSCTAMNEASSMPEGSFKMLPLLNHLRNPQNLLTYMIFTAWCKFMGVSQYIPTVTVG